LLAGEVSEELAVHRTGGTLLPAVSAMLHRALPSDLIWHVELDLHLVTAEVQGLINSENHAARLTSLMAGSRDIETDFYREPKPADCGPNPAAVHVLGHRWLNAARWLFESNDAYADLFGGRDRHSQMGIVTYDQVSYRLRRATSWCLLRADGGYSQDSCDLAAAIQPALTLLERCTASSRTHDVGPAAPLAEPATAGDPIVTAPSLGVPAPATDRGRVAHVADRHGLTRREEQVLELLCQGLTQQHIGHLLRISPRTAAKHLQHVYDKLGIHDRLLVAAYIGDGRIKTSAEQPAPRV
jgi:DNA-binding CsgD family transcriptional regulator